MHIVSSILLALWHTLLEMSPYLLFGFLVAGILSVVIPTSFVEKHLGRGRWLPSVKAALFGVPLPLCSCGVIPVAAGLKRQGASHGATTAFLLSTPQTGVDSMLVTYSLLGMTFALFAPVAALVSGVMAGLIISVFVRPPPVKVDLGGDFATPGKSCCSPKPVNLSLIPEPTTNACTAPLEVEETSCCSKDSHSSSAGSIKNRLHQVLQHGFITLPKDLALPLLWGLLVAGLLSALIPEEFFTGQAGSGWLTKVLMLGAGIPMYVCATASVPIAASLIAAGISPGAAFIFLMSGPATNAATITTIWKLMGRRTLFIYLGVVVFSALSAGVILDKIFVARGAGAAPMHHEMMPEAWRVVFALILIGVLVFAKWGKPILALRCQDGKKD